MKIEANPASSLKKNVTDHSMWRHDLQTSPQPPPHHLYLAPIMDAHRAGGHQHNLLLMSAAESNWSPRTQPLLRIIYPHLPLTPTMHWGDSLVVMASRYIIYAFALIVFFFGCHITASGGVFGGVVVVGWDHTLYASVSMAGQGHQRHSPQQSVLPARQLSVGHRRVQGAV